MTPTSLCHTSACCCSMRTLGNPGEKEKIGSQSDPGPGEKAFFLGVWERRAWGWYLLDTEEQEEKNCFIYFLQSPLLGSSAPGSQCAFLYVPSLEAALCQGQNPGYFQPNLHHVLHTSEYHCVLLNWLKECFLLPLMNSITKTVGRERASLDQGLFIPIPRNKIYF